MESGNEASKDIAIQKVSPFECPYYSRNLHKMAVIVILLLPTLLPHQSQNLASDTFTLPHVPHITKLLPATGRMVVGAGRGGAGRGRGEGGRMGERGCSHVMQACKSRGFAVPQLKQIDLSWNGRLM